MSSFHEPLLRLRFRVLWMMAALAVVAGCGLGEGRFDRQNARAHIERLAGAIGSRPAGSPAISVIAISRRNTATADIVRKTRPTRQTAQPTDLRVA